MKLLHLLIVLESALAQSLRPAITTSLGMSNASSTTNTSVTMPLNSPTSSSFTNQSLSNSTTAPISPITIPSAEKEAPKNRDYPFYFITTEQITNRSPGIVVEGSKEVQSSLSELQLSHYFEFDLKGFSSTSKARDPFYELQMRYSSPSGDGSFLLYHVTQNETGTEELVLLANVTHFNATGSWQRYATMLITSNMTLPSLFLNEDTAKLRSVVREGGFNWMFFYFIAGNIRDVPGMTSLNPRRPKPTPPALGRLPFFDRFITIDDFIEGSDDLIVEQSIEEGRSNFGQLNRTSWMQFRLSVPITGLYNVHVRLASLNGDGSFDLMRVEEMPTDMPATATAAMATPTTLQRPGVGPTSASTATSMSTVTATNVVGLPNGTSSSKQSLKWIASFEDFPVSGSWDQYTRITQEVLLEQGERLYSINVTTPGFNLAWLYFEPSDLKEAIAERNNDS